MRSGSHVVETLGETFRGDGKIAETLGEAPCPTPGCEGTGIRQRILKTVITTPCPKCSADAERRELENERQEQIANLLNRSGRTELLAGWSLDSYPSDDAGAAAKKVALRWLDIYEGDGHTPNLLLYGPVGGGKTGLAWGLVRHLCENAVEARLINFPDLLDQMREAYSKRIPFDRFSNIARVPVIALDDVGAEKPTEWAVSQLLALVDARYNRCLPTIFTSNFDPNELEDRLGHQERVAGERIVSRMTDRAMQHRIRADDRRDV